MTSCGERAQRFALVPLGEFMCLRFFSPLFPLFDSAEPNVQFVCLIKVGVPAMHPQRTALNSIKTRLGEAAPLQPSST